MKRLLLMVTTITLISSTSAFPQLGALKSKAKQSLNTSSSDKGSSSQPTPKNEVAENETFYKNGGVAAAKSNPSLEEEFVKNLNEENSSPAIPENERVQYKKALLIFTDWVIEKNELGTPTKMTYAAWMIGRYTGNQACFFQKVYMKKDYLGGGEYGTIKYDESQKPSIISCELIK